MDVALCFTTIIDIATHAVYRTRDTGLGVRNPQFQVYSTQDSANCTNQSVLESRATLRVFFVAYVNIPTVEILIALINIFVEPK